MPANNDGTPDPSTDPIGFAKHLADAVKASVDAIKAVQDLLSSPRSVVIEIDNATKTPLVLRGQGFSHGGFAKTPAEIIAPMSNNIFGAQSTGFATGVEGTVTYGIDSDPSFQFSAHFDNPFVGSNSSNLDFESNRFNRYRVGNLTGAGNTGAEIRFWISDIPGPFSVRQLLSEPFFSDDFSNDQRHSFNTALGLRQLQKLLQLAPLQGDRTSLRSLLRL
jgi:hypothetical protein